MSEAQLQAAIIEMAQLLGKRVAHFRSVRVQRKDGSVYYETPVQADGKGFPDLVIVGLDPLIFDIWEVKTERGRLSMEQLGWKTVFEAIERVLNLAGVGFFHYRVVRPSDWRSGAIEEWLR